MRRRRGAGAGTLAGASRPAAAPSASPETAAPSLSGERGCAPALAGPPGVGSALPPGCATRGLGVVWTCGSSTGYTDATSPSSA